jgi:hypothetical protein
MSLPIEVTILKSVRARRHNPRRVAVLLVEELKPNGDTSAAASAWSGQRAKKRLPESTGPRGAEDTHLFRERLVGTQPVRPCSGCKPGREPRVLKQLSTSMPTTCFTGPQRYATGTLRMRTRPRGSIYCCQQGEKYRRFDLPVSPLDGSLNEAERYGNPSTRSRSFERGVEKKETELLATRNDRDADTTRAALHVDPSSYLIVRARC